MVAKQTEIKSENVKETGRKGDQEIHGGKSGRKKGGNRQTRAKKN